MTTVIIIVLLLLLAIVVALVGVLFTDRSHLRRERDRLQMELGQTSQQHEQLAADAAELRTQLRLAQEAQKQAELQFQQAQQQARDTFKALAGEVLSQAKNDFLQLARKSFEGEQKDAAAQLEQRKQAIEALIKPIRDQLDQHAKVVAEVEKHREGAYQGLRQQITSMLEGQQRLGDQTTALSNALRRTDVRGRWGEITLKRIAEMAGMVAHCDFQEQVTIWKGDENQRPDMVIHMPSDRLIIVDAKGVGNSYLQACEASDSAQRRALMQQHLRDIESRVRDLSAKAYHESLERTPDFVVLFIPGESFLHPAAELRPDLIEWALANRVALATPTTLIGLLKVVEMGWREERLAENAAKISDLGRELHSRIGIAFDHLGRVGKALGTTVAHYNKLVGSLESSVLPQSRRFKELGADSAKELPAEIIKIEDAPREPAAPELTAGAAKDG